MLKSTCTFQDGSGLKFGKKEKEETGEGQRRGAWGQNEPNRLICRKKRIKSDDKVDYGV